MDEYYLAAAKRNCTRSHLFFTRYFYKMRTGSKFICNWHHEYISEVIDRVIGGELQNVVINVAPGSSKTELVVINLIARGLALNPRARFFHLSYSDQLALLNSQIAKDIVSSEEFQALWPLRIAGDTKSKKRWNVVTEDGKRAGGVYATSLSGQVTGFRAGHMEPGFNGAIIIDDPLKPEDAFSKLKLEQANRRLLTTVESRRARPDTPVVIIMQRIAEMDPVGFIEAGGLPGKWHFVKIPALISMEAIHKFIPWEYRPKLNMDIQDKDGRFSYWEEKEPVTKLVQMEQGGITDKTGNMISKHVFTSQYQQSPVAMGGNVIKGQDFVRYKMLPAIKYRKIYADTAQKTKEHNDFSVFECWGYGADGRIYLIDMIRGKWESPELRRRARAFWNKHHAVDWEAGLGLGQLREMKVEDKSSGTDVIQSLKSETPIIPIKGIERNKDKYTRVQDALPYIEMKAVCVPEDAEFTNDLIAECEAFKADMTHAHDDQVDPMLDAIEDMLSTQNKMKVWESLGG